MSTKYITQTKRLASFLFILVLLFSFCAAFPSRVAASESDSNTDSSEISVLEDEQQSGGDSAELADPAEESGSEPEQVDNAGDSVDEADGEEMLVAVASPLSDDDLLKPVMTPMALADSGEQLVNTKTLDGIYFRLSTGYSDTAHWRKALYGLTAYCVEPAVMNLGSEYYSNEVSGETWYRMSLADYWGFYIMNQIDGRETENNFYVQLYVWEQLGHKVVELSGATVSLADYNAWKAKIEPCIKAFFTKPSFAGTTTTIKVGNSATLTDTNGSFSYYKLLADHAGVDPVLNGESVTFTANAASNNGIVQFKYYISSNYERPMYYWTTNNGQDVATIGVGDPTFFDVSVNIIKKGTLDLVKTSEDGVVSGLQFNVKSTDGSFNQNFTTNSNGRISQELDIGKYVITEISVPTKYVAPASKTVELKAGETTSVSFNNVLKKFRVTVSKVDTETTNAQGGASLQGAVYGMYDSSGKLLDSYTTDSNGGFTTKYYVCGSGYYIQEISPSPGYTLDTTKYTLSGATAGNFTVELNSLSQTVKEQVIRGGVLVQKWDNELNQNSPQGDASLSGAVFDIYNRSAKAVLVGGTSYEPGKVVHTMTTNASGVAQTASNLLPYGTYEVVERTPPQGYLNTGSLSRTFSITQNGVVVQLNTSSTAIKNNVVRGGVRVEKWDNELDSRTVQGNATLAGAVFDIYNRSKNAVLVNGTTYEPGKVVHTMTTNASGVAETSSSLLPYGTYELVELTPPQGYQNAGSIRRTFSITQNGVIVQLNESGTAIKNNVIRGGVSIEKWDKEINQNKPQGGATLQGAVFDIYNRSAAPVLVDGELYPVGSVVISITTNVKGVAATASNALPYGTYQAIERVAPTGYQPAGILTRTFTITENNKIVYLNTSETAIKNDPIRGDIKGVKVSDGDMKRLANVPFKITSATTGESHIIVTDENGQFDTSSAWNPHTQNTNRGETEFDGIWFGDLATVDNSVGALLYDTYVIEEQPCEANAPYELLPPITVKVYRNSVAVDLGTLTNDYTTPPQIGTSATDSVTGSHTAYISKITTIIDVVEYTGAKVGVEYTLKGTLMDKETGKPLLVDGKQVTGTTTFTPDSTDGFAEVRFTFDSLALAGKRVVVFEKLFIGTTEIGVHEDIEDEGQTISFIPPEIGTIAVDRDSETHYAYIDDLTCIVDTVQYVGLTPGYEHTIKGVLMDRESGKPLLVDGKEVTGTTTFTPEEANGTVEVTYTLSSTDLAGKSIVVFETLIVDNREIAAHEDIEDEGQTVTFEEPEIGTTAADIDADSNNAFIGKETTIVDLVRFTNLKPGREYTVIGILMDKESGEPLLVDGEHVTGNSTFTPDEPNGTVEVSFTFNSLALAGQSVVVFESLYIGEKEIATHSDIDDEDQTVDFEEPEIGTTAIDSDSGNHSATVSETTTIIDTVAYENLKPGEEYTIQGILMLKSTGEPLLVDGKEVTAAITFTPETPSGTVQLEFTFSSAALKGETVVAFESVYVEDIEIAVHDDINDFDQSVSFETPYIGTTAKDSLTGSNYAYALEEVTIIDTVRYTGLTIGQKYTLAGVLMDKTTGKPLLVEGKDISKSVEFIADAVEGSVDITFTFSGVVLKGKDIVVYETLWLGQNELATHEDIEDKGQTVTFMEPEISTSAREGITGKNTADPAKLVTIIDTVTYKGLKPGDEYTVKGILMDKDTGEPLLINGKKVTAESTFTAAYADGTVELPFTFDSSALAGKEVVVFESLYYQGKEIAIHADINDAGQTVTFNTPTPLPKDEKAVPNTGDSMHHKLWIALAVCSAMLIGAFIVLRRRRKNDVSE